MGKVNSVEEYIEVNSHFGEALTLLRQIINSTELEETLKWNAPVYTLNGKNVLGLGAFKNHFGIWFFNGIFLNDKKHLLSNAQEKTKALRQMRFESTSEIDKNVVLSYNASIVRSETSLIGAKTDTTFTIIGGIPFPSYTDHAIEYKQQLEEQPEFFGNIALGYDIAGFSGRISVFHQSEYNLTV